MAGVRWSLVTGLIATGTSVKTLIQAVAPAQQRLLIDLVSISFEGISNTGKPILVEILYQTDAGTTSALTPKKMNPADNETLQVTGRHTATAEPSAGDVVRSFLVHPQTGQEWQAAFGKPLVVIGGGRLGLRVTADASVNAVVTFEGEE